MNVGTLQLEQNNFVERLRLILQQYPGISPGSLELEIIETSALADVEEVSQIMRACDELGVSFALDDFGTGYSSLTYLKRLPALHLKIDRSFVRDMLDDPDDLAILEGVLGLATAFHRKPIAEGVESIEQGTMLLQLGCELAQGNVIAPPMPASELGDWYEDWTPPPAWMDQRPVSRNKLPLLSAAVSHRAWIREISGFLEDRREQPPELDHESCEFSHWLRRLKRRGRHKATAIQNIDREHRQIHKLAQSLCSGTASDQETGEGLSELFKNRDRLLKQLDDALRTPKRR